MRRLSYRRRAEMVGVRPTEANMVEAILQTINLMPKTFAWRMETTGSVRRDGQGGFKMVRNRGGRGKADICGVTHGLGFVLEAKMPGEQLKPHQAAWLKDYVECGGGYAAVVRSVEDAEQAVREILFEKVVQSVTTIKVGLDK